MIRLLATALFSTAFAGLCTSSAEAEAAVGYISGNQYVGNMPSGQSQSGATYNKVRGAECKTHYECKSGFCNQSAKLVCNERNGDGTGGSERQIASNVNSLQACMKLVVAADANANGATWGKQNKKCYKEVGMTGNNNNSKYKTCKIEKIIPSNKECKCSGWRNAQGFGGPGCHKDGHDKPWCYVGENSGCSDAQGSGVKWSVLACQKKEGPEIDFTNKYDGDIYEGEPGVCLISYCAGTGPGSHSDHPEMCLHRNGCPVRNYNDYCDEAWDCGSYKCEGNKCTASTMNWSDEVYLWDERSWDERRKGTEGLSEVTVGLEANSIAFVGEATSATSYFVNGFALLGLGALLYGAGAHYFKKQPTHVEF